MEMTSVTNVLRRICCWIYNVGKAYGQQSKRKAVDEMISCQDDSRPIFSEPYTIVGRGKQIRIGRNFISQPGLKIECIDCYAGKQYHPCLSVGDNVFINSNCHIGCINKIVIGNNVMIGSGVLITDHQHGTLADSDIPVADRKLVSKGSVAIGDNVWIGEHVCILSGVTIGEGSIIGANAVVTKSVPAHSLAVGVPAKVVEDL